MKFLTIELIKKHLNIDEYFTDDDSLLEVYGSAAELSIERHLDCDIYTLCEDGELPEPIKAGMLLLVGNLYLVRESIAPTTFVKVPDTIDLLLRTYVDYSPLSKRCECC